MIAEQQEKMENMINLCLDFWSTEKQCGRLYHRFADGPFHFSTLLEALIKMSDLYDAIGFPQKSADFRHFRMNYEKTEPASAGDKEINAPYEGKEMKAAASLEDVMSHRGADATFLIRVQYRQHTSWQGEVTWIDGQQREYFRSALELIRLLDSVSGLKQREEKNM